MFRKILKFKANKNMQNSKPDESHHGFYEITKFLIKSTNMHLRCGLYD